MYENFYLKNLYPLQDNVLQLIQALGASLVSASSKSAGIFAPLFAERLSHFDFERLQHIKWNENYDWKQLELKREEIVSLIIGL